MSFPIFYTAIYIIDDGALRHFWRISRAARHCLRQNGPQLLKPRNSCIQRFNLILCYPPRHLATSPAPSLKLQQGTDLLDPKAELSRAADKPQPLKVISLVGLVPSRALRSAPRTDAVGACTSGTGCGRPRQFVPLSSPSNDRFDSTSAWSRAT